MMSGSGQVIAGSQPVFQYLSSRQQENHGFGLGFPDMPRRGLPQQIAAPRGLGNNTTSTTRGGSNTPLFPGGTAGVVHAPEGFAIPVTNPLAAPHHAYEAGPSTSALDWLPQDTFASSYAQPGTTYPAEVTPWTLIQHQSAASEQQQQQQRPQRLQQRPPSQVPPQQASGFPFPPPQQQQQQQHPPLPNPYQRRKQPSPPRSRNPLTPSISVTTELSSYDGLRQPQDPNNYPATTPVTSASSYHPPDLTFSFPTYLHGQFSSEPSRYMNSDQREMQTPPRSPHAPGLAEPNSRKRSHSIMSNGAPMPLEGGSPSGSVASLNAHSPGDEFSPRTRTFKREDAPPTNAEHKYICTFAPECAGLTFDRKCEWSKHMDKHDRPYRCSHASCAKLQGFTYSGGLLRHEREVHGKHGGPKAQLMCPYKDCKRHAGKGFTRKENLNEHIRRVHQTNKDDPATHINLALKRDGTAATDAFPGAEELEALEVEAFDPEDQLTSPVRKRRRHVSGVPVGIPGVPIGVDAYAADEVEDLKREIHTLREENLAKENRIVEMELRLEEEKQSRQEEMARLHESMRQLQHQQQAQQAQQLNAHP